jgi:hypothetical protein
MIVLKLIVAALLVVVLICQMMRFYRHVRRHQIGPAGDRRPQTLSERLQQSGLKGILEGHAQELRALLVVFGDSPKLRTKDETAAVFAYDFFRTALLDWWREISPEQLRIDRKWAERMLKRGNIEQVLERQRLGLRDALSLLQRRHDLRELKQNKDAFHATIRAYETLSDWFVFIE